MINRVYDWDFLSPSDITSTLNEIIDAINDIELRLDILELSVHKEKGGTE